MSKLGDTEHKSAERLRFRHYLRTGRWIEMQAATELERKFNPYHDPDDGRFTFAPGHPRSSSNVIISKRRDSIRPAGRPRRNSEAPVTGSPKPYLSELHNELDAVASKYPPRPGSREWTALDAAAYLAGKKNIHAFKAQWVRGYRDAIKAAGLFIAAKHLADLRDVDAKGRSASQLTASDIAIIGARYNQGPDVPREQLVRDLSYGRNILKRWRTLGRMLEDNP